MPSIIPISIPLPDTQTTSKGVPWATSTPREEEISLLDFSKYSHGSEVEKAHFCTEFAAGLARFGFIKIYNHGFEDDDLKKLFDTSRTFFSLPHEEKMVAAHPKGPVPHRGYSFVGQEITSVLSRPEVNLKRGGAPVLDIKETFDYASQTDTTHPNRWPAPTTAHPLRPTLESFFLASHTLHMSLLRALATGLSLPPTYFLPHHTLLHSEARILHYPACPSTDLLSPSESKTRISEHTDFGSMTLLLQDSTGGLEIEDPLRKVFFPVTGAAPIMLVNLGDAMHRWTNGVLPSAYHRVRAPPGMRVGDGVVVPERYSVAYFGKPDRGASLRPMEEFVTAERLPRWGDVTSGEHDDSSVAKQY